MSIRVHNLHALMYAYAHIFGRLGECERIEPTHMCKSYIYTCSIDIDVNIGTYIYIHASWIYCEVFTMYVRRTTSYDGVSYIMCSVCCAL